MVPATGNAFWGAAEAIGLQTLNHARSADRIAINLVHLQRTPVAAKIAAWALDDLRRALRLSRSPRLIGVVTVSSLLERRSVKRCVFAA